MSENQHLASRLGTSLSNTIMAFQFRHSHSDHEARQPPNTIAVRNAEGFTHRFTRRLINASDFGRGISCTQLCRFSVRALVRNNDLPGVEIRIGQRAMMEPFSRLEASFGWTTVLECSSQK